jgi:hypothetical protein
MGGPAGQSLHRLGTELDLGRPAAYGWPARNAEWFTSLSTTGGGGGTAHMHGNEQRARAPGSLACAPPPCESPTGRRRREGGRR